MVIAKRLRLDAIARPNMATSRDEDERPVAGRLIEGQPRHGRSNSVRTA
jgi:hypothetical protein